MGLEPTTFCMANASDRSLLFAPVRSNRLFAGHPYTRANGSNPSERRTLPFLPRSRRRVRGSTKQAPRYRRSLPPTEPSEEFDDSVDRPAAGLNVAALSIPRSHSSAAVSRHSALHCILEAEAATLRGATVRSRLIRPSKADECRPREELVGFRRGRGSSLPAGTSTDSSGAAGGTRRISPGTTSCTRFDAVLDGDRPHLVLEYLDGPRLSTLDPALRPGRRAGLAPRPRAQLGAALMPAEIVYGARQVKAR
jgi:hypothetical protein